MKTTQAFKTMAQSAFEPLETLKSQVTSPILGEAANELGGFFGTRPGLGRNPREIGHEELQRAREKQNLDKISAEDKKSSVQNAQSLSARIRNEYQTQLQSEQRKQHELKSEFDKLQSEVAKLAKTAGVDTKAHLDTAPKKIGILDIKSLKNIIHFLTMKVEDAKNAQDMVSQRENSKRTTGMLAWVSGKQMKVHEQGTLQLQG